MPTTIHGLRMVRHVGRPASRTVLSLDIVCETLGTGFGCTTSAASSVYGRGRRRTMSNVRVRQHKSKSSTFASALANLLLLPFRGPCTMPALQNESNFCQIRQNTHTHTRIQGAAPMALPTSSSLGCRSLMSPSIETISSSLSSSFNISLRVRQQTVVPRQARTHTRAHVPTLRGLSQQT